MTVSWNDRCISYPMLLQGASAQETARWFRVNTGAVVEWAGLAGMAIRMGARGGIEPVCGSESTLDPQRACRRLTQDDRIFIEMATNSTPGWSIRSIGWHLGVAASTIFTGAWTSPGRDRARPRCVAGDELPRPASEPHYAIACEDRGWQTRIVMSCGRSSLRV